MRDKGSFESVKTRKAEPPPSSEISHDTFLLLSHLRLLGSTRHHECEGLLGDSTAVLGTATLHAPSFPSSGDPFISFLVFLPPSLLARLLALPVAFTSARGGRCRAKLPSSRRRKRESVPPQARPFNFLVLCEARPGPSDLILIHENVPRCGCSDDRLRRGFLSFELAGKSRSTANVVASPHKVLDDCTRKWSRRASSSRRRARVLRRWARDPGVGSSESLGGSFEEGRPPRGMEHHARRGPKVEVDEPKGEHPRSTFHALPDWYLTWKRTCSRSLIPS